ncbi:arylesterase [Aliikangiella sp. G2MR2-5]|uniref:arylesterase n=1 Tax=Aliikangiella sp. G2MR2-5 TaxID=2788943 RepID=UPI0018AA6F40|nr:arylesterase [Aliikangiella sp. G2MR2-5]
MRNYIYGLLILISTYITFNLSAASENSTITAGKANSDKTILVFGDSLSAAYNIPIEQGWVSLLQNFLKTNDLNVKLVNASISGETTSGGLERLEKQLKLYNPDIVILELGGNDGLRGLSLTATKENLSEMIKLSTKYNSEVLLVGIKIPPNYGRTYTSRFEKIYTDLAQSDDVTLLPFLLEPITNKLHLLQADGIHPKAEAQPLLMKHVFKTLESML